MKDAIPVNIMDRINANHNISSSGSIITIIHDKGTAKLYTDRSGLTLKYCYEIAEKCGHNVGTITVLVENPHNDGFVYKYGHHGDFWERVGRLTAYA